MSTSIEFLSSDSSAVELLERRDADLGRRGIPQRRPELHRAVPALGSRAARRPGGRPLLAGLPRRVPAERRAASALPAGHRRPLQGDGAHVVDGQIRRHLQRSALFSRSFPAPAHANDPTSVPFSIKLKNSLKHARVSFADVSLVPRPGALQNNLESSPSFVVALNVHEGALENQ